MKAVVIGGSNGIGLAISNRLIIEGYHVAILDRQEPEQETCLMMAMYLISAIY